MCGIAGIVDFNQNNSIEPKLLKKMSDIIIHRGPDAEGQWFSEDRRCGLAFRRLAIIDLSAAGNQPMHTPDKRLTIVFNGEIYNHLNLRRQLIERGYNYHSNTDTETILYGYSEWQEEILSKMFGMWGLAIWDNEKKELFAARDRVGIKPFYYYYKDGIFVFGSEIKSILQHPSIKAEMNEEELPNYLNFGMSSNTSTLFKNIHKLRSGHFLKLKSNGELFVRRYWSPLNQNQEYTKLSEKEIQEELINMLRRSIKDRMMSDVPFGVFLSGGVDSSLNVALMSELMSRPVDTFTVGFKDLEKYNELAYARKIADLFKTNHKEILIGEKESFEILEKLPWYEDEPNADPVCIPLYFLSKLTRDSGTIVIQVGEGSDEQFAGYTNMLRDYNFYKSYWKLYVSLPSFLKKAFYYPIKPILEAFGQILILEYLRRGSFNKQLYWGGNPVFSVSFMEKLFNDKFNFLKNIPDDYADNIHKEALAYVPKSDYLQRMMYAEFSNRLPEILLMRVDKIGMAHSIEARVPFLDHRLVEFASTIPDFIKIPNKITTKHILKKAVEGILPDEIIYRKKQGFWAPVNEWLRNEWFTYASSKILNSKVLNYGILNKNYIDSILQNHKNRKQNHGLRIFTLLMLSIWHETFIEKNLN